MERNYFFSGATDSISINSVFFVVLKILFHGWCLKKKNKKGNYKQKNFLFFFTLNNQIDFRMISVRIVLTDHYITSVNSQFDPVYSKLRHQIKQVPIIRIFGPNEEGTSYQKSTNKKRKNCFLFLQAKKFVFICMEFFLIYLSNHLRMKYVMENNWHKV